MEQSNNNNVLKRQYARIKPKEPIRIYHQGGTFEEFSGDISLTGCRVYSINPFSVNDKLTIGLPLLNQQYLQVISRVTRVSEGVESFSTSDIDKEKYFVVIKEDETELEIIEEDLKLFMESEGLKFKGFDDIDSTMTDLDNLYEAGHSVSVLIADLKYIRENAINYLNQVHQRFPQIKVILFSSDIKIDTIIDITNRALADIFFFEPLEAGRFMEQFMDIYQSYQLKQIDKEKYQEASCHTYQCKRCDWIGHFERDASQKNAFRWITHKKVADNSYKIDYLVKANKFLEVCLDICPKCEARTLSEIKTIFFEIGAEFIDLNQEQKESLINYIDQSLPLTGKKDRDNDADQGKTEKYLPLKIDKIYPSRSALYESYIKELGIGGLNIDIEQELELNRDIMISLGVIGYQQKIVLPAKVIHSKDDDGDGFLYTVQLSDFNDNKIKLSQYVTEIAGDLLVEQDSGRSQNKKRYFINGLLSGIGISIAIMAIIYLIL